MGWLDHTFDRGIARPRGPLVPQFGCENHSKDELNSTGDVGYHSKTIHMLLRELMRPIERRFWAFISDVVYCIISGKIGVMGSPGRAEKCTNGAHGGQMFAL